MIHRISFRLLGVLFFAGLLGAGLTAQAPGGQPSARPAPISLKVDVTISRYEGDKRTSSKPYSLRVTTGSQTSFTTGRSVPIPSSKDTITYHPIGTNLNAGASHLGDGRFSLDLRIEETSLEASPAGPPGPTPAVQGGTLTAAPAIVSLRVNNIVVLGDGETAEFLSSTDPVSGAVSKVEVRLTVLK